MMKPILQCFDLSVSFGGVQALDGVTLSVTRGEVVGIFGPNGAGKTTLFNAITGHVRLSRGRILLADREIGGFRPDEIFRFGLARTFQLPELVETQSVEANVLLGAQFSHGRGWAGALRFNDVARNAADEAIAKFDLEKIRDKKTGLTSLYERKLIMMASAFAARPQIILLDEPAGGLTDAEISSLIQHMRMMSAGGTTMLLIEHVMPVIVEMSTRVIVLNQGRILAEGDPDAVRNDERVKNLYFGEAV